MLSEHLDTQLQSGPSCFCEMNWSSGALDGDLLTMVSAGVFLFRLFMGVIEDSLGPMLVVMTWLGESLSSELASTTTGAASVETVAGLLI